MLQLQNRDRNARQGRGAAKKGAGNGVGVDRATILRPCKEQKGWSFSCGGNGLIQLGTGYDHDTHHASLDFGLPFMTKKKLTAP